jgi:RHS repeat-associated protein
VTRLWWLEDEVAVRLQRPINDSDLLWVPRLSRTSGVLGALGEWYYPGPGTDQALASFNFGAGAGSGHRHHFIRDWRGSVVKVVENDNSAVWTSEVYEAFGKADGAHSTNGPGFNGAPSVDGFQYLRNRWYDPGTGRFTQEDPIGFAGGINLYSYVGSNPVQYSDPYGLWFPKDHDKLIDHALADIPESDREALKRASRGFDQRTQDPSLSYMHGMSAPGQGPDAAKAATAAFVENMLHHARADAIAGNRPAALNELGIAMHPLMDMTSPSHTDPNGDPRVWQGKVAASAGHAVELFQHPTADVYRIEDRALRNAYNYVFGH